MQAASNTCFNQQPSASGMICAYRMYAQRIWMQYCTSSSFDQSKCRNATSCSSQQRETCSYHCLEEVVCTLYVLFISFVSTGFRITCKCSGNVRVLACCVSFFYPKCTFQCHNAAGIFWPPSACLCFLVYHSACSRNKGNRCKSCFLML